MNRKALLGAVASLLAVAPAAALAQSGGSSSGIQDLRQTCAQFMSSGHAPRGQDEQSLRRQCSDLLMRGSQAQSQQVQPGQGTEQPQQGAVARAANILGAGQNVPPGELVGQNGEHPVLNTVTTNPIGILTGEGLNAEFERPVAGKVSWMAGARYAQTSVANGSATNFGAEGGVDYFLVGQNNEGLRIGPRVELGFSRENVAGETLDGRLAAAGELGYNYIAPRGLTGSAAVGLGGQLFGSSATNAQGFLGTGAFAPYAKLGLGYSW
jgi:hypothetical protein